MIFAGQSGITHAISANMDKFNLPPGYIEDREVLDEPVEEYEEEE
jgi:hypothetical protein